MWKSKIHTEISLRYIKSDYIAIVQALLNTIHIIDLLKEMKSLGCNDGTASPTVLCKIFEDKSGAMILARVSATIPRQKTY